LRPSAPVVGVGGVVVGDGRVLLIRRGKPPLQGRWVVPGGTVELGETLEEALVREMREETGLEVEPVELLTVFNRIDRDGDGVAYHYVIVDYLCRRVAGVAVAGSDALEVAWLRREDLAAYDVPPKAVEVVEDALRRAAARGPEGSALRDGRVGSILDETDGEGP
jgi:8-oxo-dGTP diphosphatase